MKKYFIPVIILFCLNPEVVAHAINFETGIHPPVVTVKAFFTRTSPLAGANVIIYAPGQERPYQNGRTDSEGYFAFVPGATGNWTITVDDERGHRGRVIVSIEQGFFDEGGTVHSREQEIEESAPAEVGPSTGNAPMVYRSITGLAVIFGITGIFYGYKSRQELKRKSGKN